MKTIGVVLSSVLLVGSMCSVCHSHCEIPCGIYDDPMRIELMKEHTRTIEKSMNNIDALQAQDNPDMNQLIRWTVNKEDHANKLQEIAYQYFMTQRVKPVLAEQGEQYEKYVRQVTLLHKILVQAMRAKQTTDVKHVENLRTLIDDFRVAYMGHDHD